MKKVNFKVWCESNGIEEVRYGTNDMVNVSILKDAFHANDEYIKYLENLLERETTEDYLYRRNKL